MSRYLEHDNSFEAIPIAYENKVETHKHTIFYGDFMGLCTHDIACQVCFDAPAVVTSDVSPGHNKGFSIQPCHSCQEKGWETNRPRWKWATPIVRWLTYNLPRGRFD